MDPALEQLALLIDSMGPPDPLNPNADRSNKGTTDGLAGQSSSSTEAPLSLRFGKLGLNASK